MSKTTMTPDVTVTPEGTTAVRPTSATLELAPAPEAVQGSHRLRLARRLSGPAPDLEALIPRFHAWIRERVLPWTLIDVTDYRHVEQGPGVLLVGVEGDVMVGYDEDGRALVAYVQKRSERSGFEAHLDLAFERLAAVSDRLADLPGLAVSAKSGEWSFRLLDRLATRDEGVVDELADWLASRFDLQLGAEVTLERDTADPRRAVGFVALPNIGRAVQPLATVVA